MGAFTIYPAVDLRQGRVVRLRQGDPDQETKYSDEPAVVARSWLEAGAEWLHVVNLDGAFGKDSAVNQTALQAILRESERLGRAVQFGGGLRALDQVEWVLSLGVRRAVLGTVVLENPLLAMEAVSRFGPEAVAAALDVRRGRLLARGWQADSGKDVQRVGAELAAWGFQTVIYTDVERDGTGSGAEIAAAQALAESIGLRVIASGGFNSLEEIRQARLAGLEGVILGRSLYEGIIRLEEALRC